MPRNEHLVLCGGARGAPGNRASRLDLALQGPSANVHLRITDISKKLLTSIPDVLVDLLEVASYVYAADSAISRGGKVDAHMGARWRRKLRFVIPVRDPRLWSSDQVVSALVETLSFLSDDEYEFEFEPINSPPAVREYFEFPEAEATSFKPDEVVMFSGGLDSFAGAVDLLAAQGKRLALVSHRSSTKIAGAQKHLIDQLRNRFGTNRVLHVPVLANLDEGISQEATHRTRSFLFAALGAVTARLFGQDSVRFFENGVVSLNLPPVAQVVGARATRTTHPQALAGFRGLLACVLGRPFDIDNPFAWLTKAEVVEKISANGCGDLIRHTRSCTRVHDMTRLHPHCGQCSQCIDRRFAILAATQEHEDPADAYKVDLLLGERPAGPDREMALAYVRSASEVHKMADVAFFARYGETSRVVRFIAESADKAAGRIWDLYRRQAAAVCRVFDSAISSHASDMREGKLHPDCLLLLIASRGETGGYPPPSKATEELVRACPEIRIAIDQARKRVLFERWGEIGGASAALLIALAAPFRQAIRDELAPERFPYTSTAKVLAETHCSQEETLRRRVLRCRETIKKLAAKAGAPLPSFNAVIENSQGHGYRLNPDSVRLLSVAEMTKG